MVLEDIADYCGISRYHLSRIFREAAGKNIRDYIIEARINAAKDLLLNTSDTISSIAAVLQFCDQSYFAASFRRRTGMTPRAYRNRSAFRPE
jgi:AraC-like DNA-binding protein